MRVHVIDTEQTFEGEDARAVVREMRDSDWHAPDKKRDYMEQVAERVEGMTGERISTDGAEVFLHELHRVGLIEFEG